MSVPITATDAKNLLSGIGATKPQFPKALVFSVVLTGKVVVVSLPPMRYSLPPTDAAFNPHTGLMNEVAVMKLSVAGLYWYTEFVPCPEVLAHPSTNRLVPSLVTPGFSRPAGREAIWVQVS